jgi:hypothetical protein
VETNKYFVVFSGFPTAYLQQMVAHALVELKEMGVWRLDHQGKTFTI